MAHDVFVSYANEDSTTADELVATLEQRNIRCWIAPRDVQPTSDYSHAIVDAISQSRVMVLVFSASSNDSPHVRREVDLAVSRDVTILPFRIEAVPLSPPLEYLIGLVHWLDAVTPPLEKNLQQLAETVHKLLTETKEQTQVASMPDSLLLRPQQPDTARGRTTLSWLFDLLVASGGSFVISLILANSIAAAAGREALLDAVFWPVLVILWLSYFGAGIWPGKTFGKSLFPKTSVKRERQKNRVL